MLKQNRIIYSMSRRATALDNAVMESFFNKLKVEIGALNKYSPAKELIDVINNWIRYDNNARIQTKLNGHSPVESRLSQPIPFYASSCRINLFFYD
ncbi:IS3 family transposase [Weissella soli]|uniref:IS3 family transposase n=3 Tax=Weissella soli TaxID=155866 RepID=UPI0011961832|nr:IS3 family transposase [Weissella soli]GEN92590.1 hypothetical protein WSO01_02020 [Weissella soli]